MGPTTIDPTFKGHMFVAITNFGRYPVRIRYQEHFCTAKFLKMNEKTKIRFRRTQDFNKLLEVFATKLDIILKPCQPPSKIVTTEEVLKARHFGPEIFNGIQRIIIEQQQNISKLNKAVTFLKSYQKLIRKMIKIIPWLLAIPIISATLALDLDNRTIAGISLAVSISAFLLNIFDSRILKKFGIYFDLDLEDEE